MEIKKPRTLAFFSQGSLSHTTDLRFHDMGAISSQGTLAISSSVKRPSDRRGTTGPDLGRSSLGLGPRLHVTAVEGAIQLTVVVVVGRSHRNADSHAFFPGRACAACSREARAHW